MKRDICPHFEQIFKFVPLFFCLCYRVRDNCKSKAVVQYYGIIAKQHLPKFFVRLSQ